jgi:hypothetical protein
MIKFILKWIFAVLLMLMFLADLYFIGWLLERSYQFFELTLLQNISFLIMLSSLNLAFILFAIETYKKNK